jgi:DNA-binding response OmpR family regulator
MKKKVLLMDDGLDEARSFSKALDKLHRPANYLPNIIFLDIKMPMTDSGHRLRELKQMADSRGIILMLYSSSDNKEEMIASDVGATASRRWPSAFAALRSRLSGVLRSMFSWHLARVGSSRQQ